MAFSLAAPALDPDGGHDAALAIMTTDTVPKEIAVEFEIGGKTGQDWWHDERAQG